MIRQIENDSHLLKDISKELIDDLNEKNVDEDIVFDIHVAFEEALRNAMVHGNESDPEKKVTIETSVDGNSVIIAVEDEGPGFKPEDLPDPTQDENLLKEGGRGVYLMRHLMDELRYENDGRKVIMIKYLDKRHL